MPEPKIYAATRDAAESLPIPSLERTLSSSQQYVDRITRSKWWLANCLPVYHGSVPTKIVLEWYPRQSSYVAALMPEPALWRGKEVPLIRVTKASCHRNIPAMSDPWVLLHEVAHVSAWGEGHNKFFIYSFAKLVKQYLGIDHHAALVQSLRDHKARLNYSLI